MKSRKHANTAWFVKKNIYSFLMQSTHSMLWYFGVDTDDFILVFPKSSHLLGIIETEIILYIIGSVIYIGVQSVSITTTSVISIPARFEVYWIQLYMIKSVPISTITVSTIPARFELYSLQLYIIKSVIIATKDVSSIPVLFEVYLIQLNMIKFVTEVWHSFSCYSGFLQI